jgi:hypothetical protein
MKWDINYQISKEFNMKRTANALPKRLNRAICTLSLLGMAISTNLAMAAIATPNAYFGSALITGADNRISVSRVPVIDSAGTVTYKDLTIDFDVSSVGELNMSAYNPTITASPALITSGFKAGNYKDARGNKYAVTGPSVIPGTTRTTWSLAFVTGADASQFSMSWVTGPITGHPNQSSLTARSITTTAYSWGIVGAVSPISGLFPFNGWLNANVVGAAQAGDQLVLHYFKAGDNIEDASVSLTYCTTAC